MIAVLLLGLLILIGAFAILGWTADSRDDGQTLWPLDRRAAGNSRSPQSREVSS